MEDGIPGWLQHCHKIYCKKDGHYRRQACIIGRWYHYEDVISGWVDLVYNSIPFLELSLWSSIKFIWKFHDGT